MYPDERVVRLVTAEFIPIRVHVRDPDGVYARVSERLNVHWTPTTLTLDQDGVERHRIEGFLPVDDFLASLKLGLAKSAFQRGSFDEAARWFGEVVAGFLLDTCGPRPIVAVRRTSRTDTRAAKAHQMLAKAITSRAVAAAAPITRATPSSRSGGSGLVRKGRQVAIR